MAVSSGQPRNDGLHLTAETPQAWVACCNSPANPSDWGNATAVDETGSVYIAEVSQRTTGGNTGNYRMFG